uniref:Uncharacterized protein n=1 Tax=Candidatus Kentrum sp. TUN TaxID=2126343 RepID=A0A451A156_9GAMM|nr:MAG: hypothetical protein BECKTUN1418F_GA0071002_11863 [Candidatus Kentron sp. TUN]VFK63421.1 MAG: hypothetical protein BECKTUN1418D_GA0071000_12123 [Candidatus Kentron sp. TUN]VFK68273.1 MAG: hypothetical protein BECKTUN1418E_GA0071001_11823 [Candidatus Kentron sp. TUN]
MNATGFMLEIHIPRVVFSRLYFIAFPIDYIFSSQIKGIGHR